MRIFSAKWLVILFFLLWGGREDIFAQFAGDSTNTDRLLQMARQFERNFQIRQQQAIEVALEKGWPVREEYPDGSIIEIQGLAPDGKPIYYVTQNLNAAKTISTDKVWPGGSAGLNLNGSGMIVGEWDGGAVRGTHQELTGRVTQVDGASSLSDHSTHVAGTMIASGVVAQAKGMAHAAQLHAWDWNNDNSEMATAAAGGLLTSNHSYSFIRGWYFSGNFWYWYGDISVSETEDYLFGFYNSNTRDWDEIAYNAPYYLIVKSAGNDRDDAGPGPGGSHLVYYNGTWNWSTTTRDPDGGSDGYDCIGEQGVAKNILTVGAVEDIPNGYSQPSDVVITAFSSWGPADDGRIKPDIVGNGVALYSCISTSNTAYASYGGTSMSSPNVAGSLILLQQHYQNLHGGSSMRAATLKGLVIHTADEAGTAPGPDYMFGWGLMNTQRAAEVISDEFPEWSEHLLQELTLSNGGSYSIQVYSDGLQPLKTTICWTDPPATPPSPSLNPTTKMLVNDLDLRITKGGTTYYPWILDGANPANPATTGDNNTDNVEQVYIASPDAGVYTITVNHKGTLQNGSQNYALIMSGALYPVEITANIKIFLQGPFDSDSMKTYLGDNDLLLLNQPYNQAPWNYAGTESVTDVPAGVVDWILVELREGLTTTTARRAAFLKSDGTIVDLDGSSAVLFEGIPPGDYYLVIHHRNHLAVMSAAKESLSKNSPLYDFTSAADKYYGSNGFVEIASNTWGMAAGDANSDGQIDLTDKNSTWYSQNGTPWTYAKFGDYNLDGCIDALDENMFRATNQGKTTQVP
ncbi:MAG: hypothetical protein Kow0042_14360 [Calditrichia bacterium]